MWARTKLAYLAGSVGWNLWLFVACRRKRRRHQSESVPSTAQKLVCVCRSDGLFARSGLSQKQASQQLQLCCLLPTRKTTQKKNFNGCSSHKHRPRRHRVFVLVSRYCRSCSLRSMLRPKRRQYGSSSASTTATATTTTTQQQSSSKWCDDTGTSSTTPTTTTTAKNRHWRRRGHGIGAGVLL